MSESLNSKNSHNSSLENQLKIAELKIAKLTIERDAALRVSIIQNDVDVKLSEIDAELKSLNVPDEIRSNCLEAQNKTELVESYIASLPHNSQSLPDDTAINEKNLHINQKSNLKFAGFNDNHILETAKILKACMSLPANPLPTFSGNPREYFGFIRGFKSTVACHSDDPTTLLSYLMNCCSNDALDAIQRCAILEPAHGYDEALRILERRFGQPHVIARDFIAELTDGPPLKSHDHTALMKLADSMKLCAGTLKQMDRSCDLNSCHTMGYIIRRLPPNLQSKWFEFASSVLKKGREPSFDELSEFINDRADAASTRLVYLSPTKDIIRFHEPTVHSTIRPPKFRASVMTTSSVPQMKSPTCLYCSETHFLDQCPKFIELMVPERHKYVQSENLCFLCMKRNHRAQSCRSRRCCGLEQCTAKHHPLLHLSTIQPAFGESSKTTSMNTSSSNVFSMSSRFPVAFAVLPVCVSGPKGECVVNAFLDNGSDTTLISSALLVQLGIEGKPTPTFLKTVTGEKWINSISAELNIRGLDSNEELKIKRALAVQSLPDLKASVPTEKQMRTWQHLQDIDINRIDDPVISLLIGCDVPKAHWVIEQRTGGPYEPYAVKGPLGWTLVGPTVDNTHNQRLCTINNIHSDSITTMLENMFNYEFYDLSSTKLCPSQVDYIALEGLKKSMSKVDGHIQFRLPWKSGAPKLPDNKGSAFKRLLLLKRRFFKDAAFKTLYTEKMEEYISKGYAERVSTNQSPINKQCIWYLPHHGVFKSGDQRKIRIVFDCAAETKGTSLNKQLQTGPDLTNKLLGVLLRFRMYPYAFTADIEAMFHQIKVHPDDRDVLRFLWWPKGRLEENIAVYRMTVHPFGATSSPCCANLALQEAIKSSMGFENPNYAETALRSFYVDDCLLSSPTIFEISTLISELRKALANNGFNLTKCFSNDQRILENISMPHRAPTIFKLDGLPSDTKRTLGIEWSERNDYLKIRVQPWQGSLSRRSILSYVASLFDPMGLVAPILLPAKRILQDLCRRKAKWDEFLTDQEVIQWKKWLDTLMSLEHLKISRCLTGNFGTNYVHAELHGFADACESGYGVCVYLRLRKKDGNFKCSLMVGKSRVTPMKSVTIPRLELSAAVLLAKTVAFVKEEINLPIRQTNLWTDSTIVLQLIHNTSSRFEVFVANRLATIHEFSKGAIWGHINGKYNPADIASRGGDIKNRHFELWFNGPSFLSNSKERWPEQPKNLPEPNQFIKMENVGTINTIKGLSWVDCLLNASCWSALLRRIAWLRRFCQWIVDKRQNLYTDVNKYLRVDEIEKSESCVLRLVQLEKFHWQSGQKHDSIEIKCLSGSAQRLYKLRPIIHDGILRVGGRLQWAPVPFEVKHPIIIPDDHPVTALLIRHHHESMGHAGTLQVLAQLREKYWIIKGQATVRRVLRECIHCRIRFATPMSQIMAPLPEDRIQPNVPPFTTVGIDYFGPLLVKRGRGTEKRYGCLFTCFTMRAIHLEISHSLDTDSFLCAFGRFVARRGCPQRVYSDNGTNFRGAEAEIKQCLQTWNQDHIQRNMLERRCDWIFTPPKASHRGGVWERMIRSVRRVLTSILQTQLVTDEVLSTVMTETEKIINDRPLTKLSDDPEDLSVLTPNLLLLLKSNNAAAPATLSSPIGRPILIKRWKQACFLADAFWKRWIAEYLPTLQIRTKWLRVKRDLKAGDLVLLTDKGAPRGIWLKGVIKEVIFNKDGHVREAQIKTKDGIIRRDIRQLCLLEQSDE